MAKYNVLRDCFCQDRFYYGGTIMELSPGLDKEYPKNFKLIEEIATVTHPIATGEQYLDSVTTNSERHIAVADVAVSTPFFRDTTEEEEPPLYVSDKPPKPKAKKKKTGK